MTTPLRLSVLAVLLVLGALPVALHGSRPAVAGAKVLKVVDWEYLDDPAMYEDFTNNNRDVDVEFKILPNDSTIYKEIKEAALPGTYHVVHPYNSWLQAYIDAGLVQEIDVNKLKNWKHVPDRLKAIGRCGDEKHELRCPPADKGKQYFIPWDIGLSSILYLTDKVETVRSWDALFDESYREHISMFKDGPSAVAVSSYRNKYDETKITPEQLEKIKHEWISQKPLNRAYWEREEKLIDLMKHGKVWLAYAWPSAYDALKAHGMNVEYADPKEGRASWVGVYGILNNISKDEAELAREFIDEKLSKTTAMNLVNGFHYAVANEEVMRTHSDPTVKELFPVDVATVLFEQSNYTPELTAEQRNEWPRMWRGVVGD